MKLYYLFAPVEPGCVGLDSGIERKIRSQVEGLKFLCKDINQFQVELVILPVVSFSGRASEKIIRRLPLTAAWRKWKYHGEFDDAVAIYIRSVYEDYSFIRYLRSIKKANPNTAIIYEIPTYPENINEKLSLNNISFRSKKHFAVKQLKRYVDRIVTFYNQDRIYGIPCIKTSNGYDFSKLELTRRENSSTINLISVAMNATWHGYDRLVEGIKRYYSEGGTEQIKYHIVGPPLPEYGDSNENIIIHGPIHGEELKQLYKQCFVGVDVLGGHRKNYPVSSSLKSREYAAYGLPIITASPIDFLPLDYKYQYLASYDDQSIDIWKILEWYHSIYDDHDCNDIAKDIRIYAMNRCDITVTMKPIVKFLLDKDNYI